jgi:ferredoxin
MNCDMFKPDIIKIAADELKRVFGDEYKKHFMDAVYSPIYSPRLPCPYCFGNSAQSSCGQCLGTCEVSAILFTPSLRFDGVQLEDTVI